MQMRCCGKLLLKVAAVVGGGASSAGKHNDETRRKANEWCDELKRHELATYELGGRGV